jgi:hypothetical protein
MNTVLKKAGIVVAAATAGLLALSPLAFAGDYDGGHDGDGHHSHSHHDGDGHHGHNVDCKQDNSIKNKDAEQRGLLNVQNTNAQVPIQACNNSVIEGAAGILGHASNKDKH